MPSARPRPANVDDYIAMFPVDVQAVLQQVRRAVKEAAPAAEEVISYGIPAVKQHGVVVYFAGFKNHIGFYPPVRGDAALEKAAARYAGDKGNLRFPLDQPMPIALIKRLTRLRAKQDAASERSSKPKSARPAKTEGRRKR